MFFQTPTAHSNIYNYTITTGGNSMHKRGYRAGIIHKAALRETTAAALVLASGWDHAGSQVLVDPMCGSGTIAIEAALIAAQTSPGLVRYSSPLLGTAEHIDMEDTAARGARPPCILEWAGVDAQEWSAVYSAASRLDRRRDMTKIVAVANDIHPGAIELCERSAHNAGVHHLIDFSCSDAKHFRVPRSQAGVMVLTNPPWDKRLEDGVAASWAGLRSFISEGLDASGDESGDSTSSSSDSSSTEKNGSRLLSRLKQKNTAIPANYTLESSIVEESEKLVPVEANSRTNGGETQLWVLSGNEDLKVALQPRKHAEALRVNAAGMRVEFLRYTL
jgi:23S rRNA G2445 N2-methylase RlmL